MAFPPPRKRQRRQQVVLSSDDEQSDGNISTQHDENQVNALDTYSAAEKQGRIVPESSNGKNAPSSTTSFSSSFLSTGSRRTHEQTKLPASLSPRSVRTGSRTGKSTTTTPTPSPEKRTTPRKKRKQEPNRKNHTTSSTTTAAPGKDEERSKSLHAFFQPATEEQRWERAERALPKSKPGGIERQQLRSWEEEDDLIEDDSADEIFESFIKNGYEDKDGAGKGGAKAVREAKPFSERLDRLGKKNGKKKFVLPTSQGPPSSSALGSENTGSFVSSELAGLSAGVARPWAEEFAPVDLDELAVHKKKVADVQNWLVNVFSGKIKSRILVLRGPAGSGKTTTVSLLSKTLGYDVIEWKNSTATGYGTQGYMSMGAQFDDFLGRSDKFSTLATDDSQNAYPSLAEPANAGIQRRVILVEEFPASLNPGSSALAAFRTALQRYLAATVPLGIDKLMHGTGPSSSPPIIIVVSETLLGTGSSLADNFTVHRLLGPEISNHPGVNIIEFNRVAPTFISKALDLILKKEARRSRRRRIPGPAVLKRISEMGDVRSAVSSLEFLCLRGDDNNGDQGWSGTVASRLKRPGKTGVRPTVMENESLEMVTQREASLGIFHAVGKVMYNKRDEATTSAPPGNPQSNNPPPHLQEHFRPRPSQVSVEDLINETGTDIQTFIAALHENYVLSCSGSTFSHSLERCISCLSDADILAGESRRGYGANRGAMSSMRRSFQGYGSTLDGLRQEEMSFHTAVHGLLFSLPYPVKRCPLPGSKAGDAHKMFFPTSLRLWRDTEELDGMLDIWIRRLTSSAPSGLIGPAPRSDGVESWKSRDPFSTTSPCDTGEHAQSGMAARALVSRDEVLLERLPYMSRLTKDQPDLKQLEKITKFSGTVEQSAELADEDLDNFDAAAVFEPWATDQTPMSPKKRQPRQSRDSGNVLPTDSVEDVVDKLVLSDDDIQD